MDNDLHSKYTAYSTEYLAEILRKPEYLTNDAKDVVRRVLIERGESIPDEELNVEETATAPPSSNFWWKISFYVAASVSLFVFAPSIAIQGWTVATLILIPVLIIPVVQKKLLGKAGVSALMQASANGNLDLVRELLATGARVNDQDDKGGTALMYAVLNDQPEIVKFLLAHGADIKVRTMSGKTALDIARSRGLMKVVSILET